MINPNLNNVDEKPVARCVECDREMEHYITFTSPTNEQQNICWECYERSEKGFNTKRDWRRVPRQSVIAKLINPPASKE
jgi:hypothetical protein